MTCVRIPSAAAARLAADLRALQKGAGTKVVHVRMIDTQAPAQPGTRFNLQIERLGPLPLIHHFIERTALI